MPSSDVTGTADTDEDYEDDGEEEVIPGLGWGQREIKEFQQMWASMIGKTNEDLKTLGITLLIWFTDETDDMETFISAKNTMFEHIPNMKKLFKNFDAGNTKDVLMSDEKFLKHAQRVVIHLNKLIKKMDDPGFIDDIRELSQAHLRLTPQVTKQYFLDFRDRFHLLVLDMTGTGKKERPATLWFQFLNGLCLIFAEEESKWKKLNSAKGGAKGGAPKKKSCCIIL